MRWDLRKPGQPWKRVDLAERLYLYAGDMTREECLKVVGIMFDVMHDTIGKRESIQIKTFGSFRVFPGKGHKITRNPATGERKIKTGYWEIRFRPCVNLRISMNPEVFVSRWYKKRLFNGHTYASRSSADGAPIQGQDPEHRVDGETPSGGGEQGG